ncbi:MAG: hypothetical protein QOH93_3256, partial [Chloroflexia bacterium]|nr:hypothetical protein [Chloroflexia bacterium]
MEDLDPEPPGRARTVRTREVWLGVLLLLGVLGWAGWQWWHGERLRNDYELGSRAVIAQQWDEARAYFQAADGYRDASTRAQDVEKKIEERNKQYEIASVHAEAGEWAVVLKAAQEVAAIQPHYKGLDALTTEAERRVYRDALNGSIARRVLDDPALYYRDAEKWVRLEESDRWSRIRAYGEDGTFLYDVPGSGWAGPPTPTPTVAPGLPQQTEVGSPELVGRRLMTVSFDGVHGPVFHKLSLDPSRYIYYVMSTAGVWGVHVSNMEYAGVPMEGLYVGSELDYEAYDSNRTSTITVAPNAVLVGFGAQGNHILLAEFDPSAPGAGGVKLYAAAPDGTQARLIYSTTGSIKSALLSPDERFVLVTTIEPQEGTNGKMAAVLLDLLGDAEPRTLMKADARVTFSNFTVSVNGPSGLRAAFLRRGRFADMVIVTINDGSTGTQVKLIDPEHPQWSRT